VAADPQRWGRFVDDTIEAFRHGGAGVRADLAVASRPWGFQLRDVNVPTYLVLAPTGPVPARRVFTDRAGRCNVRSRTRRVAASVRVSGRRQWFSGGLVLPPVASDDSGHHPIGDRALEPPVHLGEGL